MESNGVSFMEIISFLKIISIKETPLPGGWVSTMDKQLVNKENCDISLKGVNY